MPLFDVDSTVLDLRELKLALRHAVRLATAHTPVGDVRPFAELMEASGGTVPEAMAPLPNVPPRLNRLREQAHRLAVVTQSARATGEQHLCGAGADRTVSPLTDLDL